MAESAIEWTDATWNPVSGCTRASEGCDNCYAVTMTNRLAAMGQDKYKELTVINSSGHRHFNGEVRCHDDELEKPLQWKKPRMVFVNSMSDLFHKDVPDDFIDKVFAVMALCPQHTFQVLTKRADRMAAYTNDSKTGRIGAIHEAAKALLGEPVCQGDWPLPNVWLGVSVENQKYADERIPDLVETTAAIKFLSVEPLLGSIDLSYWLTEPLRPQFQWVIVGGESGSKARPMNAEWTRSIRDQCKAAGVSFFFKQWGEWIEENQMQKKVGKKYAGRLLDGREWSEFPKVDGTKMPPEDNPADGVPISKEEWEQFQRNQGFKRMARNMAAMIDWPHEDDMERASGQCTCDKCGLCYSDHPHENGLVLTCDGRLWKL